MNRIGIVGLDWRHGGEEAISRFTLPSERRSERLPAMAHAMGAKELCYLATCNRVELCFVAEEPTPAATMRRRAFLALAGREPQPGEAERTLRAWAGEGAVEHLFLVAAGLDSARLGETEIAGQVRAALEEARRLGLAGRRVSFLWEEALKVARRVRRQSGLGLGRTSLAELALERIDATRGPVALIGVSPMTRRCAESLAKCGRPLVWVNRTVERATRAARELGIDARPRPLAEFRTDPDALAVVVSATGAPLPILDQADLIALARASRGRLPLLVDLALPPDIAPEAARALGFERVGMEEINAAAAGNQRQRRRDSADARALVDDALDRVHRRLGLRSVESVVTILHDHYRETALVGVEDLLRRGLGDLDPEGASAVRRWAEALARRFAHLSSRGLREVALQAGPEALSAFLSGAERDLARKLGAALDTERVLAALPPDEEDPP